MRYAHSIELNHQFLIIGITGPLRSGCTTAAEFFAKHLESKVDLTLKESDDNIAELYKELHVALEEHEDQAVLENKKRQLYESLKLREIKDTLHAKTSHEVIKPFHHISMSLMVVKYALEFYHWNRENFFDARFGEIIFIFDEVKVEMKYVDTINRIIDGKRYRELDKNICDYYDGYLKEVESVYYEMRRKVDPDTLGLLLQDMGDNIRRSGTPFSNSSIYDSKHVIAIAEQANQIIRYCRNRQDSDENRRHHFIIESFRNPYEVDYFRYRYYEFYLFSIYADKKIRQSNRGQFSETRDSRDSGAGKRVHEIYKQDVAKCVYLSDVSVNNEGSKDDFYKKLLKYYTLILQPGCVTPSFHEVFMNEAYALSLKSSCISRQVGAVIIGKNGYVVGAGWNDAGEGQVGCGYRQVQDLKALSNDTLVTNPPLEKSFRRIVIRDKEVHEPFCFKDEYSNYFLAKKISAFMKERLPKFDGLDQQQKETIEQWLKDDIKVKRLEYCRALHAEENALLQSSKIGGVGVKGGIIFTTAFPCELCAKKLYQSGISEIVYTEPYPDSISQDVILKDGIKKIKLTQFEGVKSHSYFRLYKSNMDKKEMMEICKREGKTYTFQPRLFEG